MKRGFEAVCESIISMLDDCTPAAVLKTAGSALVKSVGGASGVIFGIIPKVVHSWFDQVDKGAREAAETLSESTGHDFEIDYRAPETADVVLQNQIVERAIATFPDGIAIDLR